MRLVTLIYFKIHFECLIKKTFISITFLPISSSTTSSKSKKKCEYIQEVKLWLS